MAYSGDRACSQLCRPPLPGAGGRKQNPINVASEPRSILQTRSLLSGPLGPPHGGGGSPAWLKARVPASSPLPAKKHLTSPRCPTTCAKGGGSFLLNGDQVAPQAIRTPSWRWARGGGCRLASPLALFVCFGLERLCNTDPCFRPVPAPPTPQGLGKPGVCSRHPCGLQAAPAPQKLTREMGTDFFLSRLSTFYKGYFLSRV